MASLTPAPKPSRDSYGSGPSAVLVAGKGEDGRSAMRAMDAAGVRTRAHLDFAEASTALAEYGGLDLIVIEAMETSDAMLDPVLIGAEAMARERNLCVVATVGIEQADMAVAHLLGPRAQLLCDPTDADRATALALACAQAMALGRGGGMLYAMDEARQEGESSRLQRLSEEVARIADTLVRLTRGEDFDRLGGVHEPGLDYHGPTGRDLDTATPNEIRAAIRARRLRREFFTGDFFADPAWDMLLDLFAAQIERRAVSVSSLCIAAAVPPTTALRWIGTLHEAGLFDRHADPSDRRRAYIALSPRGLKGMREYVSAVKRAGLNLV